MPSLRHALLVALISASSLAQVPPGKVRKLPPAQGRTGEAAEARGDVKDVEATEKPGVDGSPLSKLPSGRGHCEFHPAVVPARIPPGGSGALVVTMALVGDMVLTTPPPVTFHTSERQGGLTLGPPTFRPAKQAQLAPAFRGQLAYDNYAVFEVPLTVDPNARIGKNTVSIELIFELHHGKTGDVAGKFADRVRCLAEIGEPLPEGVPTPRGDQRPARGAADSDAEVASRPAVESDPPGTEAGQKAAEEAIAMPKPVAVPDAVDATAPPVPPPPVQGDRTVLYALVGLAGLLGILGLALARRK